MRVIVGSGGGIHMISVQAYLPTLVLEVMSSSIAREYQ